MNTISYYKIHLEPPCSVIFKFFMMMPGTIAHR